MQMGSGAGAGSGTAVRSLVGTQQGCPQLHSPKRPGRASCALSPEVMAAVSPTSPRFPGRSSVLCPHLWLLAALGPWAQAGSVVADRNRNLLQLHFIVFLINFLSHGGI